MPQDMYGGASFAPITFDGTKEPAPDLSEGKYRFKITEFTVQGTKPKPNDPTSYPMFVLEVQATKVLGVYPPGDVKATKDAKASIGSSVNDYVALYPEHMAKRGRMGKARYRAYCALLGIPFDVLPKNIESAADFEDLKQKMLKKGFDGYIVLKKDREGEIRPNLLLAEPQLLRDRTGGGSRFDDNEEEAEAEPEEEATDPSEPEEEEEEPTEEVEEIEPEEATDEEEEPTEPEEEPDGGVVEPEEEPEPEPPPQKPVAAKKTAKKGTVTQPATPAASRAGKK